MAQIKSETITIVFSRLVKDSNDTSAIINEAEFTDISEYIDAMNEAVTDGRIIEIDIA